MDGNKFQLELNSSVHAMRGALTDLMVGVGANPAKPQDVSRRFGIDKSLAWKISRVVRPGDPGAALPHVPGEAAMDIFLGALEKAGAAKTSLDRARESLRSFQTVVERHVGDRPTLELVLDALPSQKNDRLAMSRKLAFRGNSGIWGVQARVRVNTVFLAPNPEKPDMIDSTLVGGWVDFRRLRHDAHWTLFRRRSFRGGQEVTGGEKPIDPSEPQNGPMFLREFCTDTMPQITAVEEGGAITYALGPGEVGNTGTFTCFFGSSYRQLGSRYAEQSDETADFHAMISAPVETLQFDFVVHHSLTFAMNPRVSVYSGVSSDFWASTKRDELPIHAPSVDIGSRPPTFSTPLVSEYSRVIDRVFELTKWKPEDFIAKRFIIDHPPFPSAVNLRVALEQR